MTTTTHRLPTVTIEALTNGKYRYRVDGEVHTKASARIYAAASVYRIESLSKWDVAQGREVGDLVVFLHGRQDLAVKGSPDANRIAETGHWSRIPGIVEIAVEAQS